MDFTGIYGVFGDEGVVGVWVPGSLGLRHFAACAFGVSKLLRICPFLVITHLLGGRLFRA